MPVNKYKLKLSRIYLRTIRKSYNLSRSELAKIIGASKSMFDRYENGSCDFAPGRMTSIFTAISELCGVSVSELIQNEVDYQNKVTVLKSETKTVKLQMPFLIYQNQISCIRLIEKKIGLSSLPSHLQRLALLRLQHPDWKNFQFSQELEFSMINVGSCFRQIKQIALELTEGNKNEA